MDKERFEAGLAKRKAVDIVAGEEYDRRTPLVCPETWSWKAGDPIAIVGLEGTMVEDFSQHAQSHGQPGIESGCQLANQSGSQHQLMTDNLGIGRGLFLGGDEEVTGAHALFR